MKGGSFLPGVMLPSVLVGPIVALGGGMIAAGADGAIEGLAAAPVVIVFSLPFGFAVSIPPNLPGAALLGWLGRGNVAARLPMIWALAGAAAAGMLAVGLNRGIPEADTPEPDTVAAMAGIGALSALLCRWKTRWN